ncbi:MAG: hypothetical protein ABIR56_01350 [Polaromonas sp.]
MLWPSGRVLVHVMLTYQFDGQRILELGCGLALASVVLHRRGGDITASDCHPLAADFFAGKPRPQPAARHEIPERQLVTQQPAVGPL